MSDVILNFSDEFNQPTTTLRFGGEELNMAIYISFESLSQKIITSAATGVEVSLDFITQLMKSKLTNGDFDPNDEVVTWSLMGVYFNNDAKQIELEVSRPDGSVYDGIVIEYVVINTDDIGLKEAFLTPEGFEALTETIEEVIGQGNPWTLDTENQTVTFSVDS